jgi:hypothetical protein
LDSESRCLNCTWLNTGWLTPVITWTGTMMKCCRDPLVPVTLTK